MDIQILEEKLTELPLYIYSFIDPQQLEFSDRIRWICQHECPMYGKTWACPPAVGTLTYCKAQCRQFSNCLLISTITEVSDIASMEETLATRPGHEEITNQVADILKELGATPYVLSTEACTLCEVCAIAENKPCRFPEKMHPCVESHGINIIPILEEQGLTFQYGDNVVTWVSLLFF